MLLGDRETHILIGAQAMRVENPIGASQTAEVVVDALAAIPPEIDGEMVERMAHWLWHRFGPEGTIEPGRYGGDHIGAAVRNDARRALEATLNHRHPKVLPMKAETPTQAAALKAWESGASLLYARPSGFSRATRAVEPTADAIKRAECAGWVAPDPVTSARRAAILEEAERGWRS